MTQYKFNFFKLIIKKSHINRGSNQEPLLSFYLRC